MDAFFEKLLSVGKIRNVDENSECGPIVHHHTKLLSKVVADIIIAAPRPSSLSIKSYMS